ncbi:MAG: hypothetical protein B7Z58_01180 [Acidiphilium sp. 37-64-53]|uniref:hypothetical protein n=1 Tax=Acidiphilium TaxID=522 RepID=UPI000BD95F28|nr:MULTISPECIES: hypothetical protein [Acidiphilium]MBW4036120.1 hypothetical protein [Pseudomonadota bacterium]OYW04209.1 MAG: hypothetical protein B7Z58_01180 [Acidiphilium sp. 37-64-53]OZB31140.1 MAG: hypothetical protein B7X49_00715 [Acidiphilium sp. 34-64-41]HQT83460.1 hypothetical protein [Acidiphilium rubrum]
MARDKSDAFKRLAENRTNEALDAIRKIGNLSNRNNYSFSPEQITRIFTAIRAAIDTAERRFGESEEAAEDRFTL